MKRIIAIILMLTLIPLCFVACGESNNQGSGTYKIKFIVDGVETASVETDGKSLINLPGAPIKNGYDFDGWFWDKDVWQKPLTADYFVNTPFTSSYDVKVYAKYTYNGTDTGIPGPGTEGDTYYDPDGWTTPEK